MTTNRRWRSPSTRPNRQTIGHHHCHSHHHAHSLTLGILQDTPAESLMRIDMNLIQRFFSSTDGVLCPWHDHLQLPDTTRAALSSTLPIDDWHKLDRLIIYTDGTSQGNLRRKAPLWVEEFATADAWAFVVIGECYDRPGQAGTLHFLGWHAQDVVYREDTTHYLGTDHIGSEHAERECLFWAGLWRLAYNINIPTVFRADSLTTVQQANRTSGVSHADATYVALRSVFQALQSGLGDGLVMDHVHSHMNEPWNDMVDCLAKTQAKADQKLQRQDVDLRALRPLLPYFWMLLDDRAGLPRLGATGFDVQPPSLPQSTFSQQTDVVESTAASCRFDISFLTVNVNSLYRGPDGVSGKLHYLRAQMQQHRLNFVGVQEARSEPGTSCVDNVLRLAGGVELWINLAQPFLYVAKAAKYFAPAHFQVLFADERRLLVRVSHPNWNSLVLVGHGPHTGRPASERAQWWQDTTRLIQQHRGALPVIVLIDANARTGSTLPPHIYEHDDETNANTDLFQQFLMDHDLCLPSTSSRHHGSHSTWSAPSGETSQRIDYVAIPVHLFTACVFSSVVDTFDLGNARDDHFGAGIQITWDDIAMSIPSSRATSTSNSAFHRAQIKTNRAAIHWDQMRPQPWDCDIQTHVHDFNRQVLQHLSSLQLVPGQLVNRRSLIWMKKSGTCVRANVPSELV